MGKRTKAGNLKVAVGYLRVSTDEQKLGPRAQAEALEAWALREGISLVAVFLDHGVSGAAKLSERPALLAALAALPGVGAGVLVAGKRDRLARNAAVVATIEAEAARAGATVRTADGASDALGSAGVLTKGMHDVLAAWEREVIRERTTAALAVKKARGERVGQVPYGWRCEDGVHLVPHDDEQRTIATVRELHEGGLSHRAIVIELERRGVRSRTGGAWVRTQVARMLQAALLVVAAA